MSDDEDAWFAPKLFGFGFGVPIAWQGWVLGLGFLAVVGALVLALKNHPVQLIPALMLPIVAFAVIGCRKTRGGCRWHWGRED
jgi:hypothetical protein